MGFSPESYTIMTICRLQKRNFKKAFVIKKLLLLSVVIVFITKNVAFSSYW